MTKKFKLYNRETGVIAELLSSGLASLRKVAKNKAYYYQAFFSLSMGMERIMKLILHLDGKKVLKDHDLIKLAEELDIMPAEGLIEEKILVCLSAFSQGDRYSLVDYFRDGNVQHLTKELILRFYNEVVLEIISKHPKRSLWSFRDDTVIPISVLTQNENLDTVNNLNDAIVQQQIIEHASKFCVMYAARLIQPMIDKLVKFDMKDQDTPYFTDHFRYLKHPDNYFKIRKTYRG